MIKKKLFGYWVAFGTWRLFLACLVVFSHLWSGMIDGYAAYAVWGFFVLSGYLMTFVLTRKYGFEREGLAAYAFNRFLRIMPSYYIGVIFGVITIIALKNCVDLTRLNPQFAMPHGWGWLNPLTLLPVFHGGNLPVPVSGALATEVGMYLLMPFMARSPWTAWFALIVGVVANATIGFETSTFAVRYTYFLTTLVAFSAGSLTCHYVARLKRFAAPGLALIAWTLHGLIWFYYDPWPWTFGLYSSVLLSVWVLVSLDSRETSKIDKTLGDWSYPVYLLHTTVAAWLLPYFGYGRSLLFCLSALVLTLGASWLMVALVDRPLARKKWSVGAARGKDRAIDVPPAF